MTSPAVETHALSRRYGRRWALIDVSFSVPAGRVAMLTGRNGSGKTTLLRVLATAIRADAGGGRVAGYDLRTNAHGVRRCSALLAHATYLYESLTAMENLQVVARFLQRDAAVEALMPFLESVGLAERASDPPSSFSAGMRKRLSLARLLLQEPSVVFLDEPYAQLDPAGFRMVDDLIDGLRRGGATVLMATHHLERGAERCDSGLLLAEGRLVWQGPPAELPRDLLIDVHAGVRH